MIEQGNYTDLFSYMMEMESVDENDRLGIKDVDEAFVNSLNKFNYVNVSYIAEKTGLPIETVVVELKDVIFQDPDFFEDNEPYDITKGWVVLSCYISGNVKKKLKKAIAMNKKFKGVFESNIRVLSNALPDFVNIDDIHIGLGASWIPVEEYMMFMHQFLRLNRVPTIVYNKELARYKVAIADEDKNSVFNTKTYGVCETRKMNYYDCSKQYITAAEIIEHTLNGRVVKVYDYIPNYSRARYIYDPVLNVEKTLEAQEKQQKIVDAFKDWVYSNKNRIAQFEEYYNEAMVGYAIPKYDGSFLKFPGLNPDIAPYQHQKNAIARVLLSNNNVLLAHDVGAGKTYEMVISVHELKRMGMSEKNLVVVPNNVLQATVDAHRLLYKDDKILVVYPKDFTPHNRNQVLQKIHDEDYVAVYMAYSSFDMVVMSKKYYVDKMQGEIHTLRTAFENAQTTYEKHLIDSNINILKRKLDKYIENETDCAWLPFEKLGINTLVVDEAHHYKNIPTRSNTDNVVGFSSNGSKKCREMLEKAHCVDRVIFATGTPLTNSQADLFAFQMYLQPGVLKYHNLNTFDRWINTFGHRELTIECDVDANSNNLRTMVRFTSFHNLGELMSLFSQVCDFHHIQEDETGFPEFNGYTDICVARNSAQKAYNDGLTERTELVRKGKVKRDVDNLLNIITDGRLSALDVRLTDYNGPINLSEDTKIAACARTVYKTYLLYPETTQIVFSDIGTPKAKFNVYDCLADELVKLGMKREEIAFVHDATTDAARSKLFAKMNKGEIKVVVGSTQKLGIGVNVQERLIAIHHLSVPWRPADMVQREGRILRKGNTCKEVFIFRYITENTFDAYIWQILENKQKFIASFLSGTSTARSMDDIADVVLSYAEVKALAIGNPLIKERVEVSISLERTKLACRSRQKQIQTLRGLLEGIPEKMKKHEELAETAEKDYKDYISRKQKVPNDVRKSFGKKILAELQDNIFRSEERKFDTYQGFDIMLPANMSRDYSYVVIRSQNGGKYYCEMELDKQLRGCSMTIDYLLEHLNERAEEHRFKIVELEKQAVEAKYDLEQDNPYVDEIEKIKDKLVEIDSLLEEMANQEKKAS